MRIEFTQMGGIGYFPALNKPVAVEVDYLDKAEAEELKGLIEAARFFDLPAVVGTPGRGAADYQYYVLSVDDNRRRHTVQILVPAEDPALQELVRAVQKHVKAARSEGRGTTSHPTVGKPRR